LPYVSLPNILAGRFVVPEILQDDATPEVLAQALVNQVGDKQIRMRQEEVFQAIHEQLRQDAGERAVEALLPLLPAAAAGRGESVLRAPEPGA